MNRESSDPKFVQGSFRDPFGRVFAHNDLIYRTVTDQGAESYEHVRDTGFLQDAIAEGYLVGTHEEGDIGDFHLEEDVRYVLKHDKVPFVTYPYEWPFYLLKSAAIFHLKFQIYALEQGVVFRDASAYNVQFIDLKPVFIDILSFKIYQEGEYWTSYAQFCANFLNPLLLMSKLDTPYHSIMRSDLEGLPGADLLKLLKLHHKLDWRVFIHVVLPSYLEGKAKRLDTDKISSSVAKPFPKIAYERMLRQLLAWVEKLEWKKGKDTVWSNYHAFHTYDEMEHREKANFVQEFCDKADVDLLWDIGCNDGHFSEVALSGRVKKVIGFDFDRGALELACQRAETKDLRYLPLFLDAANPSPNQGWFQKERMGIEQRQNADAIIALAFIHHLSIARNIPIGDVVAWLTSLAPYVLVEFVPKNDSTSKHMLALREDIFESYDQENFESIVNRFGTVFMKKKISSEGRYLYGIRSEHASNEN